MTSLDALLSALHDPEPSVRLQAVRDLTHLGDPRAAGPLAALLYDPRRDVRRAASRAVWPLGEAGLDALMQASQTGTPVSLEALWSVPPHQTATLNRIPSVLLFALLGRFIVEKADRAADYERHLKRAFTPPGWEALLGWQAIIEERDRDDFASGLYWLVETTTGDAPAQSRTQRSSRLLLLIEDDLHLVEGIIDVIEMSLDDVAVLVTASGSSGLVLAQVLEPDLILTDQRHPGLSGMDSIRYLRANPKTVNIPLAFCSAAGGEEKQFAQNVLGPDAVLTKPFAAEELLRLLDRCW